MIHLDANGSTAMLPEVVEAMLPWLYESGANPSAAHASGRRARQAIEDARERIAAWLGADADEIVFTAGGTEGANTAIHSLDRLVGTGTAVVSSIEHSAVLRAAENLERQVKYAPVDGDGVLDLERFSALLPEAAMISVMAANNETGVVQPLSVVCGLARERGIPVHSDAVQAAGKTDLDVRRLGVDMLSISAHKFHGPQGVGALYARRGVRFSPLLVGGSQENGRRAGTENTAGIVGMAAAAAAMMRRAGERAELQRMRDAFESAVLAGLPDVAVNGNARQRLPNTSNLSFAGCEALALIPMLDEAGIECSAASACLAGKIRPSHVQLAMGMSDARGRGSVRFSFSLLNQPGDAETAARIVIETVRKLRGDPALGHAALSCGLGTE